jgi:hypothetical protein
MASSTPAGSSRTESERATRVGVASHVPREVVANIAMYTNDGDLQSLCDATGRLTIKEANYHRYDPRPYLQNLVRNPNTLLTAMREWNVVLSGSRASAFFYPSASTNNSDWDFYCTGGVLAASMFCRALWKMGAVWGTTQREIGDDERYNGSFLILRGTLRGQSIQLMWYNRSNMGAFATIVEFHSSIVQCFISGWCAVSMYHKASSQDKMIVWELDEVRNPEKKAKAPRCVAKYVKRGFKEIPYSKEAIGVNQNLDLPWNTRRISDEGCLVIDFKNYTTYSNQRLNALHDAAMEEIKNMRWTEFAGPAGRELRWSKGSKKSTEWGLYRCLREDELTYNVTCNCNGVTITFPQTGPPGIKVCEVPWVLVPGQAQSGKAKMSRYAPI